MKASNLEVKTIVTLIAEGHIKGESAIELIAKACEIDTNKLSNALKAISNKRGPSLKWSVADDATLIRLWNSGKTTTVIAETMGRTRPAVGQRISSLRTAGHILDYRPSNSPVAKIKKGAAKK
jgi:hypothetical protein